MSRFKKQNNNQTYLDFTKTFSQSFLINDSESPLKKVDRNWLKTRFIEFLDYFNEITNDELGLSSIRDDFDFVNFFDLRKKQDTTITSPLSTEKNNFKKVNQIYENSVLNLRERNNFRPSLNKDIEQILSEKEKMEWLKKEYLLNYLFNFMEEKAFHIHNFNHIDFDKSLFYELLCEESDKSLFNYDKNKVLFLTLNSPIGTFSIKNIKQTIFNHLKQVIKKNKLKVNFKECENYLLKLIHLYSDDLLKQGKNGFFSKGELKQIKKDKLSNIEYNEIFSEPFRTFYKIKKGSGISLSQSYEYKLFYPSKTEEEILKMVEKNPFYKKLKIRFFTSEEIANIQQGDNTFVYKKWFDYYSNLFSEILGHEPSFIEKEHISKKIIYLINKKKNNKPFYLKDTVENYILNYKMDKYGLNSVINTSNYEAIRDKLIEIIRKGDLNLFEEFSESDLNQINQVRKQKDVNKQGKNYNVANNTKLAKLSKQINQSKTKISNETSLVKQNKENVLRGNKIEEQLVLFLNDKNSLLYQSLRNLNPDDFNKMNLNLDDFLGKNKKTNNDEQDRLDNKSFSDLNVDYSLNFNPDNLFEFGTAKIIRETKKVSGGCKTDFVIKNINHDKNLGVSVKSFIGDKKESNLGDLSVDYLIHEMRFKNVSNTSNVLNASNLSTLNTEKSNNNKIQIKNTTITGLSQKERFFIAFYSNPELFKERFSRHEENDLICHNQYLSLKEIEEIVIDNNYLPRIDFELFQQKHPILYQEMMDFYQNNLKEIALLSLINNEDFLKMLIKVQVDENNKDTLKNSEVKVFNINDIKDIINNAEVCIENNYLSLKYQNEIIFQLKSYVCSSGVKDKDSFQYFKRKGKTRGVLKNNIFDLIQPLVSINLDLNKEDLKSEQLEKYSESIFTVIKEEKSYHLLQSKNKGNNKNDDFNKNQEQNLSVKDKKITLKTLKEKYTSDTNNNSTFLNQKVDEKFNSLIHNSYSLI